MSSESRSDGRSRESSAREFSAGGVVVRGDEVLVIVPVNRAADGSVVLALPKGHLDEGETAVQAATREVREETGVVADPVCELGKSLYWYRRDGKTIRKSVAFFLFNYVEGDTADHDGEVEEVSWFDFKRAREELTYGGEREMVSRALAILRASR
ncbi:MAG TPA: NUDIX domain-containing protein [Solirubrobacteraceae bacterium]|jgi:8-oxo-dGTP pyrophosphatase MutT (NUDIX family)